MHACMHAYMRMRIHGMVYMIYVYACELPDATVQPCRRLFLYYDTAVIVFGYIGYAYTHTHPFINDRNHVHIDIIAIGAAA